jgi:UDP-2,3-diacylglucosamine hydrolase
MSSAAARRDLPGLPHFSEFDLPRHWRAVDIVSDLHLSAATPRTHAALIAHLNHTPADAVLLLGDLFEVWIGDDAMNEPFEAQIVEQLAQASSQRHLGFMQGNRDFLVGRAMLAATGMRALTEPTVLCAWGQRVLLSHGDALCLADVPYQQFRRTVRSSDWQSQFLAKPLAERARLAAQMRAESEAAKREAAGEWADVDSAAAVSWMHAAGTHELVHGHTHRPASHTLAPGYKRHVLSDWDCDHAERAEVLRLSRDGLTRVAPSRG